MSAIPLRPIVLPAEPGAAVRLLLPEIERMQRGGDAIAPVSDPAQTAHLPPTVPEGTGVVLSTSGSTGPPKRTALPRTALLASAHATLARLGGPGEWLLCLPLGFVAGFQVLSRAGVGGTAVTTLAGGRFDAAAFVAAARRMGSGRRYTALVPTQVRRLLADAEARAELARFDAVLVGGAPLDRATADRLREVTRHLSTYGMTETGGGCVYDGVPLDGVQVRLVDDIVHIGGPTVAGTYLGAAEAEQSRFSVDAAGVRWFRTADRARWDAGRLVPLGRTDDLINTGGVKVSAGAVEEVLLGLDWVDSAVVMGLPDPEWGELVSAHVVPRAGMRALGSGAVRESVGRLLGRAAMPKRVVFGEDLPLLPNSKIDRSAIRTRLSLAPAPAPQDKEG
ncbi:AMP-binding protein [Streptomyces sp. NPDC048491]|uniref:AMP-binding protein n=1 Tax=Streptomyces sp. NPDC048491 TaxID=3157207 RepID=UPI00341A2627